MKTKIQIAHEKHDQLTRMFVDLELEVLFFRLENKTKEKEKMMIERDEIELRISLLEQYMKSLGV